MILTFSSAISYYEMNSRIPYSVEWIFDLVLLNYSYYFILKAQNVDFFFYKIVCMRVFLKKIYYSDTSILRSAG